MRVRSNTLPLLLITVLGCADDPAWELPREEDEGFGELVSCPAISAINSEHVTAGRAYAKTSTFFFFRFTTYYARGSELSLGTNASARTTLYALGSDVYTPDLATCTARADSGVLDGGPADAGGGDAGRDASAGDGSCVAGPRFGVNIHNGSSTNPALVASTLRARNLRSARMDLFPQDPGYLTQFRAQVAALAAQSITVEAILYDDFSRGNSASSNCNADPSSVEQRAYDQTLASAKRTIDVVTDYELQNEISLYDNIKKLGTTGQTAADYDVPCARMQAANLRGMSRALVDLRASSGKPLRIILGTTDRSFGFLAFMEAQRVQFDVVGYHIYPANVHAPLDQDPWFGAGGPLTQLARFNRPIRINEFNCSEIYDAGYENRAGANLTETCFKSLTKHLLEVSAQKVANVEALSFYELLDEPGKPAPENRFGLLTELTAPKVHLYIASAFAGGTLSASERSELSTRGLLSAAQIDNFQRCAVR